MSSGREVVVVKYGSTSVGNEQVQSYANQIARLPKCYMAIVVASGSIAAGDAINAEEEFGLEDDEILAGLGSAEAFLTWQKSLHVARRPAVMVPITNHEIDSEEGEILRRRLFACMAAGAVPVANGNDVLSDEGLREIRIDTDNDRLAAHIARLTGARHLALFTDEKGVLDNDGELVEQVGTANLVAAYSFVKPNMRGRRGGMQSKITEAYGFSHEEEAGYAHIAKAGVEIIDVIEAKLGSGTHFAPHG